MNSQLAAGASAAGLAAGLLSADAAVALSLPVVAADDVSDSLLAAGAVVVDEPLFLKSVTYQPDPFN